MGATVVWLIFRSAQYLLFSHSLRAFTPLLELQPQQHSAMFSRDTILASFIMCSQLAAVFLDTLAGVKPAPQ